MRRWITHRLCPSCQRGYTYPKWVNALFRRLGSVDMVRRRSPFEGTASRKAFMTEFIRSWRGAPPNDQVFSQASLGLFTTNVLVPDNPLESFIYVKHFKLPLRYESLQLAECGHSGVVYRPHQPEALVRVHHVLHLTPTSNHTQTS